MGRQERRSSQYASIQVNKTFNSSGTHICFTLFESLLQFYSNSSTIYVINVLSLLIQWFVYSQYQKRNKNLLDEVPYILNRANLRIGVADRKIEAFEMSCATDARSESRGRLTEQIIQSLWSWVQKHRRTLRGISFDDRFWNSPIVLFETDGIQNSSSGEERMAKEREVAHACLSYGPSQITRHRHYRNNECDERKRNAFI